MALALYRKYRPARFADVVGQEHVTEPLSVALESGRINHAYLFSGPRGCGKTSSARILARSLNCELGPTPNPCGTCPSCVSLAPGGPGNIDVTELDAASHGGVDDTRELRDRAFFAPAESRYRVFIVDEAHMITTQGFNALLKIVEEPPEHLVFVFATTEPDKVLPTIRSRTHHYPFRLIPPGILRTLLERICVEEGAVVAPAVYPLVIRAGGGSARDTLSVLDQLLAGAGPEGITYERAVALLGVTDVALIDDTVDGLAAGDRAAVFEAVDRLVEAGHDPRRFASDLLQRLRDLTLLQAVPEAANRGLVDAADDELERMVEQAARLGPATLARYGEIVHTGLTEMRGATAPRLLLELLCARMLLPAASDSGLLERLERMERRIAIAPAAGDGGVTGDDAATSDDEAARRSFTRPSVRGESAAADGTSGPDGPPDRQEPAPRSDAAGPGSVGPDPTGTAAPPNRPASGRPGPAGTPTAPDRSAAAPPDAAGAAAPPSRRASAPPAGSGTATRPRQAGTPRSDRPTTPAASSQPGHADADPTPREQAGPPPSSTSTDPVPTPTGLDAAAVRRVWPEILATAKQHSRSTEAMLVNATVRAVDGDVLVLHIGAPSLARRLAEQRNAEIVTQALHAVLGVRWRIRCESGEAPSAGRAAAPRPEPPAHRPPPRQRAVVDDEPLPPEPPPEDAPPDDEESMIAEAAADAGEAPPRRDPEEVAIELLTAQLGARTIDRG
ncbi:MAG: DNA polymerase III subunit gamma and tau [Pseudonocardia sp.]